MKKNDTLNSIRQLVLERQLGKSMNELENFLLTYSRQQDMMRLESLRDDYERMADYWKRGFDDPQREQVFNGLLKRMFVLASDVYYDWQLADSSYMKAVFQRTRRARQDWSMAAIRADLEAFVSNVTMLELEPEHTRQQKSAALYSDHWELMCNLFDYILTSGQWSESLADAFLDMLLSPTLASVDQQLLVSAITLSAMQHFCFQKFRVLCEVYRQATDEPLRQRALVGWVLTAHSDDRVWQLYSEMNDLVAAACQDERCKGELAELQMQLVYCQQADADRNTIQNEILPDIISGSKMQMTKGGLVEMDEDTLDDILHPEASELAMERMEQSMHRMVDMQKQGADIYFGGFSQMKRFPFFSDISNWFVPFYSQHPGISQTWNNTRGGKFLKAITRLGAFCDSDKYSFVLAFNMVLDRLPQSMLKMIEQGEATAIPMGGEVALDDQRQPAFIRRIYLQDLYRFFRLFSAREEFVSPFASDARLLFFASEFFGRAAWADQAMTVARFLMKRHNYQWANQVLANVPENQRDLNYFLLRGAALQHIPDVPTPQVEAFFRQALALQPDNERALAGVARTLFERRCYDEALENYQQLIALHPDHRTYQLNAAVCLLNVGSGEEALKSLYKLNYMHPDDRAVSRVLAWALTVTGKYDQAEKHYTQLLAADKPAPQDLLNLGYCLWFARRIDDAISQFRHYVALRDDAHFDFKQELLEGERRLLAEKGIGEAEKLLMFDAVTGQVSH